MPDLNSFLKEFSRFLNTSDWYPTLQEWLETNLTELGLMDSVVDLVQHLREWVNYEYVLVPKRFSELRYFCRHMSVLLIDHVENYLEELPEVWYDVRDSILTIDYSGIRQWGSEQALEDNLNLLEMDLYGYASEDYLEFWENTVRQVFSNIGDVHFIWGEPQVSLHKIYQQLSLAASQRFDVTPLLVEFNWLSQLDLEDLSSSSTEIALLVNRLTYVLNSLDWETQSLNNAHEQFSFCLDDFREVYDGDSLRRVYQNLISEIRYWLDAVQDEYNYEDEEE